MKGRYLPIRDSHAAISSARLVWISDLKFSWFKSGQVWEPGHLIRGSLLPMLSKFWRTPCKTRNFQKFLLPSVLRTSDSYEWIAKKNLEIRSGSLKFSIPFIYSPYIVHIYSLQNFKLPDQISIFFLQSIRKSLEYVIH